MTEERYRHLTGDIYWDSDRGQSWKLAIGCILAAVVPPAGGLILGYVGLAALTTDVEE